MLYLLKVKEWHLASLAHLFPHSMADDAEAGFPSGSLLNATSLPQGALKSILACFAEPKIAAHTTIAANVGRCVMKYIRQIVPDIP